MKKINLTDTMKKIVNLTIQNEEISRVELSRKLDVNKSTITYSINELEQYGIICESGDVIKTNKRNAKKLMIRADFVNYMLIYCDEVSISIYNNKFEMKYNNTFSNLSSSHNMSDIFQILSNNSQKNTKFVFISTTNLEIVKSKKNDVTAEIISEIFRYISYYFKLQVVTIHQAYAQKYLTGLEVKNSLLTLENNVKFQTSLTSDNDFHSRIGKLKISNEGELVINDKPGSESLSEILNSNKSDIEVLLKVNEFLKYLPFFDCNKELHIVSNRLYNIVGDMLVINQLSENMYNRVNIHDVSIKELQHAVNIFLVKQELEIV